MNYQTRRRFLQHSVAAGAIAASPLVCLGATKANRTGNNAKEVTEFSDQWQFDHKWAQLPAQFKWQTTHNVAVDSENRVYVIHEGRANLKDHPAIFVFDEDGKYIKSFGSEFQGGGHGIEVHKEGNEEFLYVCAYQHLKTFAKLTLDGKTVWQKFAPMKSEVYADGEASKPEKVWGRDRFMPTNIAFLPDGDFLVADGYGSWFIHRYDKDGNWKSKFGGPGEGSGTFNTPHGIWIDTRGETPLIVVADRAHHTLQTFSIDGQYKETISGFGLPANVDTRDKMMLVPELFGCVSILDENNQVIARIGDDAERIKSDNQRTIRSDVTKWKDNLFVHPHDACFDNNGNIYVAEWVATGRVTKLTRR